MRRVACIWLGSLLLASCSAELPVTPSPGPVLFEPDRSMALDSHLPVGFSAPDACARATLEIVNLTSATWTFHCRSFVGPRELTARFVEAALRQGWRACGPSFTKPDLAMSFRATTAQALSLTQWRGMAGCGSADR